MANTVKLTIKVEDDGSLSVVAKNAKKAATETEKLGTATDNVNKKRNRYNRTEKGVGQLTANSTKAFSKQAQTISGGLVPAYAVLASNIFALTALFGFLKNASDVRILEQSQVSYAQNTGVALQSVTSRLREASDGLLGFQEAGQAAAIGLAKGFSPKQLEDLAVGARKASTALGRDFQDSFDRLVRGASKAEPELLDELGITLRLADATQKYADAIGKNRDQLNDYERSQAVLIETQRQLEKNFGSVDAVTNPFVKLSKTLEDIVKTVTQAVLPVFEGFASLINRSGGFAIAAFGLLALNIAKAAFPVDAIKEKIAGIEETSKTSLTNASKEIEDFKNKIKAADADMAAARAKGVQDSAKSILKSGGGEGSKLLEKVAKNQELSPQQKGRLKKMLKDAEMQYQRHGAVIKNTFKGVSIDMIRQLSGAMDTVDGKSKGFFARLRLGFTRAKLEANRLSVGISRGLTKSFMIATSAASKAGAAFNKALSFAGFIGIFVIVFEFLKKIYESPYTILAGLGDAIDKILTFMAPALDFVAKGFLTVKDTVVNTFNNAFLTVKETINDVLRNMLSGIDTIINSVTGKLNTFISGLGTLVGKDFGQLDFNSTLADSITLLDETPAKISKAAEEYKGLGDEVTLVGQGLRNFASGMGLANHEMEKAATRTSTNALKGYNEQLEKTKADLDAIRIGYKESGLVEQGIAAAKALGSLGVVSLLEKIKAQHIVKDIHTGNETQQYIMQEEERKQALINLKEALSGIIDISPQFAAALEADNVAEMERLTTAAMGATGGMNALEEGLKTIQNELKDALGGGDMRTGIQLLLKLKSSAETAKNGFEGLATAAATAAGAEAMRKLQEALGKDINANEYLADLQNLQAAQDANALATANLFRTTGKLNEARKNANEIASIQIKNALIEKTLQVEKDAVTRAQLELQKKLNEANLEALRIEKIKNSEGQFAAAAATPDYQGISNTLTGDGAFSDKVGALNDFVAPFAATMKSLGPEGEAMSVAITGLGMFTENTANTLEALSELENGGTKSQKFAAGLSIAANAVQTLGSIQAAKSKAAIAGIDREIAAEKKRDGKSKESVAKIKALEAKKEAMKRKAFERDKKMQMAQAAMGTAAAIVNALTTTPFLPAGLAMAVIAGAMGAAQIAMIASTSYQGGGASANAGAGTPSAISLGKRTSSIDMAKSKSTSGELGYFRGESGTGGAENFKPSFAGRYRAEGGSAGLVVGEQAPELFVPEVPGRVVPNEDVGMGGTSNVTFNINTVDATGVEELLVSQRGNIIGMLRDASNSYGKPFMEGVSTSVYTPESAGVRSY